VLGKSERFDNLMSSSSKTEPEAAAAEDKK